MPGPPVRLDEVEGLGVDGRLNSRGVTPGIRPIGTDFGDQRRVMTPAAAIRSGADYLVIGRPITQAENPVEALNSINASIA